MSSQNNPHKISFQLHIDAVKEEKITWNSFVQLMEDFFYSDMDRLKHLNEMILTELTGGSYSDIQRLRYLSAILLKELKISIDDKNEFKQEKDDDDGNEDFKIEYDANKYGDDDESENESKNESENENEKEKENKKENDNEELFPNALENNTNLPGNHSGNETENDKNLEPEDKLPNNLLSGQKDDFWNKHYKCDTCSEPFTNFQDLETHLYKSLHRYYGYRKYYNDKGQKYYKCESCGKIFKHAINLNNHISAVHEGRKDYKCEFCGKCFSEGGTLKKHIHTIHEGRKDNKRESCGKSMSELPS